VDILDRQPDDVEAQAPAIILSVLRPRERRSLWITVNQEPPRPSDLQPQPSHAVPPSVSPCHQFWPFQQYLPCRQFDQYTQHHPYHTDGQYSDEKRLAQCLCGLPGRPRSLQGRRRSGGGYTRGPERLPKRRRRQRRGAVSAVATSPGGRLEALSEVTDNPLGTINH
jgi:hypothetical protein